MKSGLFILLISVSLSTRAQVKNPAPKTYTVILSIDQWEGALQSLDSANKVMIGSDAPARNVSYVTSKLSFLVQTIQYQVSQQLQAEQKVAADTTKPATKKPK